MSSYRLLFLLFCRSCAQFANYPTSLPFSPQHVNSREINPVGIGHYQPFYSSVNNTRVSMTTGVNLQLRLISYVNGNFQLPNGNYCNCPTGADCGNSGELTKCHVRFVFVVTVPGEPARMIETAYFDLDAMGRLPMEESRKWSKDHIVLTKRKPTSLDIFVQHYGYAFKADGQPTSLDKFHILDEFSISIDNELPALPGAMTDSRDSSRDYIGTLSMTHMQLFLSVSCTGSLVGPDCDLECTASEINTRVAACRSHLTGYFAICNYNAYSQVENCQRCPWGIRDNTYCQDDAGGVLDPSSAGVVDTSYRTATIALAIVSIGLILAICILASLLFCRRSMKYEDEALPGYNAQAGAAAAARPLLQARYSGEQPQPTPLPRTAPASEVTPTKSALRKPPVMVPPAHLGGSTSLNDTLNTSFSSDVPMRPSRSEIV